MMDGFRVIGFIIVSMCVVYTVIDIIAALIEYNSDE